MWRISAKLQMFFNKQCKCNFSFISICFCHLPAKSDRITMLDNTHLAFFKTANAPWRQQTQQRQKGRESKGSRWMQTEKVIIKGKDTERDDRKRKDNQK